MRASQVSLEFVKLLVAHGADVNIKDTVEAYITPLTAAIYYCKTDIVRFLLNNNASVKRKGIGGRSLLYASV